jgi:hypothetical protein
MLPLHQLFRLVDVPDIKGHQVLNPSQGVPDVFLLVLRLQHQVLNLPIDLDLSHHGPFRGT